VGCETIYTFIYRTAQAGQGSEYPAVIIPVLTHHYAMLQRNLLYTGVTRGKRLVVVVGQKKAVAIGSVDVHAMFSLESTSNGRRVSVHWFAGVLQRLCSPS
jgi:hypothetical protein